MIDFKSKLLNSPFFVWVPFILIITAFAVIVLYFFGFPFKFTGALINTTNNTSTGLQSLAVSQCPESCDDGDSCTKDDCSADTNYQCVNEEIEDCGGTITTTTKTTTSLTTTTVLGDVECEVLGCSAGTTYVGSKNSDLYHPCGCRYAKNINTENLVCFSTKEDAESKGYFASEACFETTSTSTTTSVNTTSSTTVSSTTSTSTSTSTTTSVNTTSSTTSTTTTTIPDHPFIEFINATEEWVKITSILQVNMTGWTLWDGLNTRNYTFPLNFTFSGSVKIHTETGVDSTTDLYWNRSDSIWNNDHDNATLKDNNGNTIDFYSY